MRYLQDGSHQSQPLMRLSLALTLALLLGFWATNFAMYFSRMGLAPASVVAYYNGSDAEFRPPRSAASMLETAHAHLPMMALVMTRWVRSSITIAIIGRCACAVSSIEAAERGGRNSASEPL